MQQDFQGLEGEYWGRDEIGWSWFDGWRTTTQRSGFPGCLYLRNEWKVNLNKLLSTLMVLKILASTFFATRYVSLAIVIILSLRAFSQGRRTNRERDLHARIILVTVRYYLGLAIRINSDHFFQGAFTPLGLTILQSLAQRGAHIIAISPHPIDSPKVTIPITLLRQTFSNDEIYAEQCDLTSPSSIRSFCTRFLTAKDQRVDAIIFAHEYQHIGSTTLLSRTSALENASKREAGSLATFLIITLLLPALLLAPVERDIRVINVVNPFYAAAAGPSFSIPFSSQPSKSKSVFLQEGIRSLRTSIFTRHLQRILDALPSAQVPKTDEGSSTIPVVSLKTQRSNIVAIAVSPGISRVDTVAPFLNADWTSPGGILYVAHSFITGLFFPFTSPDIYSSNLFCVSSQNLQQQRCKPSFMHYSSPPPSRFSHNPLHGQPRIQGPRPQKEL